MGRSDQLLILGSMYMQQRLLNHRELRSKAHQPVKKQLVVQMDLFARSPCRQTCKTMRQKLPHKLCDDLYTHAHVCEPIYVAPPVLLVYEPPEEQDAPGKTCPINTPIVLGDFMKISPVTGMSIEVTSSINSGEEDEHRFRVVEILDFVTMMGRIYQASRKGHRVLKLYLKTHPGLRFAVPNAHNSDQDD